MHCVVLTIASGDSNRQNDDKKDYAGHYYYDAYTVFYTTAGSSREEYLLQSVTVHAIDSGVLF